MHALLRLPRRVLGREILPQHLVEYQLLRAPLLPLAYWAPLHLLVENPLDVERLIVLPPIAGDLVPALAFLAAAALAARPHLAHNAIAVAARVVARQVVRLGAVRLEKQRLELGAVGDAVGLRHRELQLRLALQLEGAQLVLQHGDRHLLELRVRFCEHHLLYPCFLHRLRRLACPLATQLCLALCTLGAPRCDQLLLDRLLPRLACSWAADVERLLKRLRLQTSEVRGLPVEDTEGDARTRVNPLPLAAIIRAAAERMQPLDRCACGGERVILGTEPGSDACGGELALGRGGAIRRLQPGRQPLRGVVGGGLGHCCEGGREQLHDDRIILGGAADAHHVDCASCAALRLRGGSGDRRQLQA
eukprot:7391797-Prymnesium_polylepis.3